MKFKPIKQINWMEMSGLLVGIFFTVAVMVFGLVLYTKLFTSGMIGVEEYKLHSTFDKALGLRPGTRVQISGVDVGQISDMKIEGDGVYMEFTLRKQFQNWITDSAQVYAIRDQNVISARVVNIDVKRGKGRVLEDGDFLPPGKAQDIETVLETANELLGHPYALLGRVEHGEHIGTQMGFPTANIVADDQCQLIPASGAYAVKVSIGDDATWKAGMMNIGTRPTFDGNHQTLEVNIFDFDDDLYGKSLCVEFVSRLREERRFDSMEALREQLEKDEIQAKKELL